MFNLLPLDFDNLIIFIISKLFLILMLKKCSLVFYANPRIVSFLTFISLMHLKCTLTYNSSHFIFFPNGQAVVPASFITKVQSIRDAIFIIC